MNNNINQCSAELAAITNSFCELTGNTETLLHSITFNNGDPVYALRDLEEMAKKISFPTNILQKARVDAFKFGGMGKKRRWIRRYIKRKYGIKEY